MSTDELLHSFKGSVWKNHKYIKKEDGRYFYPKESAAAGAYDNEIGVKEGQLKILYDTKAAHTKRMNESLEAGDEKAAAEYKKYIENIDEEVAALKKELDELHEHANLNIKSPYNARRLKKLSHSEDAEDLLNDFLQHYGVGPDENPPGRGSGRYAKGSGKDPYQHDPAMRKKLGLFGGLRRTKEEREAEKKRKRRLASLEKARKTAKANREKAEKERVAKEKYETEKNAALASGDPEKIAKYATNLTNQEQQDAIRRIENIQNLNRKASEAAAAREAANRKPDKFDSVMTKVESLAKKGVRIRDVAEDGIKIWNTFATINNAFNPDGKLPKIGSSDDKKDNDQQNNGKKPNNNQQNNSKKPNQESNNRDFKRYDNSNPDDVTTGPVTVEPTNPESNTERKTDSKQTKKDTAIDGEFREVKSETSRQPFSESKEIAPLLTTLNDEGIKRTAENGVKYYMTTINGGGTYPGSSSESAANYNRSRAEENRRYNEWESEQQRGAANRAKDSSESGSRSPLSKISSYSKASNEDAQSRKEIESKREAQKREYERVQKEQEEKLLARRLRTARETRDDARRNMKTNTPYNYGAGMLTSSRASKEWEKLADAAEEDISRVYDEARKKGLDIDEILRRSE